MDARLRGNDGKNSPTLYLILNPQFACHNPK
jgi:hypothetical protein